MLCKICERPVAEFGQARVLNRYEVRYFRCRSCGFIQTEDPYWLDEAYSDAIARGDLGLIGRNIHLAKLTRTLALALFDSDARFIDYGGGYGLLVRMLRDAGLDFYWRDRWCPNLFAKGFEATETQEYELLTAFEVFEHLADPLEEIAKTLAFSRNVLFTTQLVPANNPTPNEWWYYALDGGQHIALYTRRSLGVIADKFHLRLCTNGVNLHLFTDKAIPSWLFRLVSGRSVVRFLSIFLKKRSLLAQDYAQISGRRLR